MSPARCSCGEVLDNPDAIGQHESECTGEIEMNPTEPETMTDDSNTTDSSIEQEINTIMPGQNPLHNLQVTRTGMNEYQVLSARNGSVTLHTVGLSEPSCTCPDWQYNREGGTREVCAHYAAAFMQSADVDSSDMGMNEMAGMMNAAVDLRSAAEEARDVFEAATVETRDQQAHAAEQASSGQQSEATGGRSDDPVVRCKAWLDDLGIDAEDYSVELHEQYGSVNISPDGSVDWWQDLTQELDDHDNSWWDGGDRVWIIQESDFGEVFGR